MDSENPVEQDPGLLLESVEDLGAFSFLNGRLLGCVIIVYIEPSSHYLGTWSPRDPLVKNYALH